MTDHVSRMVNGWYQKAQRSGREREAVSSLVDSIHRMIREAERETQQRCAEIALHAGVDAGSKVAQAIRSLKRTPTPPNAVVGHRSTQPSAAWGADPQT